MQAEVVAGETYDLTVSVCSEGAWIQHTRAWFDWNWDGLMECGESDPGEDCDPPGPAGCAGGEMCLPYCTCGDVCGNGICGEDEYVRISVSRST